MLNPVVDSVVSGVTDASANGLFVKVGTHIKLVDPADIVYAEASGNYIGIVMAGGETLHTKETVSHFESRLPHSGFVRVHRSYIVNIKCLREIKAHPNGYDLILTNGRQIVSGSTYRKAIRARFLTGLGRKRQPEYADSGVAGIHAIVAARQSNNLPASTHIRLCVPGDENALSFVGKAAFMETYAGTFSDADILSHCVIHDSPDTYRELLENPRVCTWIAETETCQAPVGYLVVAPPSLPYAGEHAGDLEILRLYLLRSFQGRGLGRNLLAKAVLYARQHGFTELLLGDCGNNLRAVRFYRRSGFRSVGEYRCRAGQHDYRDLVFSLAV